MTRFIGDGAIVLLFAGKPDRDPRRFPAHQEVLRYLEDFADEFGLNELIRYQTEVSYVGLEKDGKWMVKYRRIDGDEDSEVDETYDAVVVCSGHFTEPRLAEDIPGNLFLLNIWFYIGHVRMSHERRILHNKLSLSIVVFVSVGWEMIIGIALLLMLIIM